MSPVTYSVYTIHHSQTQVIGHILGLYLDRQRPVRSTGREEGGRTGVKLPLSSSCPGQHHQTSTHIDPKAWVCEDGGKCQKEEREVMKGQTRKTETCGKN